ncbi:MAG: CpsD/CapB family tyrosine-protein kinase, partial [Anaerolineales bacterium]|nr:CpsD/CapB family tyrosine-protein kinase [Anaerolineales bacterium]
CGKSQEEAAALLGAPILGPVSKGSGAKKIIALDKLWSPEANSLRAVRDNMMLSVGSKTLRTLLVTSSDSGEGKSYLSTNLAVTMASPGTNMAAVIASPGSKVILVDADLRKPSLHELFDMPNLLGLADVLAMPEVVALGMLKKALRPTHIANLMLLPAGRNPLDPGSLVSSPNFAKVLEYLKTQADLIVIDSGPLLEVVETKVIANQADGVVLVVSNGRSSRRHAKRSIQYFKHNPSINFLGLVFNRVNLRGGYGYGYDVGAQKFGQLDKTKKPATLWQKSGPLNDPNPAKAPP